MSIAGRSITTNGKRAPSVNNTLSSSVQDMVAISHVGWYKQLTDIKYAIYR